MDLTLLTGYKNDIVTTINTILVPVLIGIAFIVFLYGVYRYFILGGADEKERTEGKQFVLWGIIGFVVIVSVWGLVNMVKNTFFPATGAGPSQTAPTPPKL